MVVDVAKTFFLDMPDLEWVCIGWVGRGIVGFSGARSGGTVEIFGEEEFVGWIVFE